MEDADRFRDIVVNLTRLTASEKLSWNRSSKQGRSDAEWDVYEARYNGRTFVLQSAPAYLGTASPKNIGAMMLLATNPQDYVLEAVTGRKRIPFPRMRAVNNLARLVTSYSNADLVEISEDLRQAVDQIEERPVHSQ